MVELEIGKLWKPTVINIAGIKRLSQLEAAIKIYYRARFLTITLKKGPFPLDSYCFTK
jgi:hypothetical protein